MVLKLKHAADKLKMPRVLMSTFCGLTNSPISLTTRRLPPSPSPSMNAEAYLRKQGWQGSGHSLDLTGRGIKKPLLIAHKQDQLGLGKKKAAYTTDDQWWMRAFDESLQNIGTGQEVRACRIGIPAQTNEHRARSTRSAPRASIAVACTASS